MRYVLLTEEDERILQDLLYREKNRRKNTPPRVTDLLDQPHLHQAPEVYIAKPDSEFGIPPLTIATGTGTGTDSYDEPGVGTCTIYKIVRMVGDDPGLQEVGRNAKVYNIAGDLPQDWILVLRTKYGRWVAIPNGQRARWAKLRGILHAGSTAYVELWEGIGGRWNSWDQSSGEIVEVYAPPLLTSGYLTSGTWVLVKQWGHRWIVEGRAC